VLVPSSPPRHPLGFVVNLDPPLESKKGEGKELFREDDEQKKRDRQPQDQHLKIILHFPFLRLGTSSLSRRL
jgi:hypothetical protein